MKTLMVKDFKGKDEMLCEEWRRVMGKSPKQMKPRASQLVATQVTI